MLELTDALPLYAQIAARLRAQIQAGKYEPGSKIASEHELSAQFGVARPTVRQATQVLVQERVLERRRGSGTYVRATPTEVDLFSAGGTLSAFSKSGLDLEARILGPVRRESIEADARGPFAGKVAFIVARRGALGSVPVLLEEMQLDPDVFPDLDRVPLAGRSLSELARERYALRPLSSEQRFSLHALDAAHAAELELAPGSAVLKVERTLDFTGAPRALFATLYCRTDQVEFTQRFALDALPASGHPRVL